MASRCQHSGRGRLTAGMAPSSQTNACASGGLSRERPTEAHACERLTARDCLPPRNEASAHRQVQRSRGERRCGTQPSRQLRLSVSGSAVSSLNALDRLQRRITTVPTRTSTRIFFPRRQPRFTCNVHQDTGLPSSKSVSAAEHRASDLVPHTSTAQASDCGPAISSQCERHVLPVPLGTGQLGPCFARTTAATAAGLAHQNARGTANAPLNHEGSAALHVQRSTGTALPRAAR